MNLLGKPLTDTDYESLMKRWIDRCTANDANLRRIEHGEAMEALGRNGKGEYQGIWIPYIRPEENRCIGYRVRRDKPDYSLRPDGSHKPELKYVVPPNQPNLLYWPPGIKPELLKNKDVPVIITEGEFKTLALWRLATHNQPDWAKPRFIPIGLGGVWNWKGTVEKTVNERGERIPVKGPIPDLDRIDWKGRKVCIAFDADAKHNDKVLHARRSLGKELHSRSALIGLLEWDTKVWDCKGVDDLLAEAGPNVVLKMWDAVEYHARNIKLEAFRVDDNGVWYDDPDLKDHNPEKRTIKICGRLDVVAKTRSKTGNDWGRLLRWLDDDGGEHTWAMPLEMLQGDGIEVRQKLANGGLSLSASGRARNLLTAYLQSAETEARVTCVDRIGWHGNVFVTPKRSFGGSVAEDYILQRTDVNDTMLTESGTLEDWQQFVAKRCKGNSRLILSVCCGLAGPLISLSGGESGGVHFFGLSSKGKSTTLMVGGSVLGGGTQKGFVQSWRNTLNGLEAIAEQHNDLTLYIDELAQINPNDAESTAYMLGEGSGKGRMTKMIGSRRKPQWTLLYVSAGEITLSDLAQSVGKKTKGGAEVRLLNVAADAGGKYEGMFEHIHDSDSPSAFALAMKEAARIFYGTARDEWLSWVVQHRHTLDAALKKLKSEFMSSHVRAEASGEVTRAAERFALIAAAGELATQADVCPWEVGEASWAASLCFQSWLKLRGSIGATDDEEAIRQVRLFLETHGASRFQEKANEKIVNRAGFKRDGEYLILPEVFRKEVCSTFQADRVAQILDQRGFLGSHDADRFTAKPRIAANGSQPTRVYVVKASILEGS